MWRAAGVGVGMGVGTVRARTPSLAHTSYTSRIAVRRSQPAHSKPSFEGTVTRSSRPSLSLMRAWRISLSVRMGTGARRTEYSLMWLRRRMSVVSGLMCTPAGPPIASVR